MSDSRQPDALNVAANLARRWRDTPNTHAVLEKIVATLRAWQEQAGLTHNSHIDTYRVSRVLASYVCSESEKSSAVGLQQALTTGLKCCGQCRYPFISDRRHRKFCSEACSDAHGAAYERLREVRRRYVGGLTGTPKQRKQADRAITAQPPANDATVNKLLDALDSDLARPAPRGRNHVAILRRDQAARNRIYRDLRSRGQDALLLQLRSALRKPLKRAKPKTSG